MAEKKRLSVEYSALSLNNSVEIVNYLKRRFTQKEVDNFFDTLKEFEMPIGIFPTLYSKSVKVKIRRAVLSKVLSVYYSVKFRMRAKSALGQI